MSELFYFAAWSVKRPLYSHLEAMANAVLRIDIIFTPESERVTMVWGLAVLADLFFPATVYFPVWVMDDWNWMWKELDIWSVRILWFANFFPLPKSKYFKSCISDVSGPKPLLELQEGVRDTVSTQWRFTWHFPWRSCVWCVEMMFTTWEEMPRNAQQQRCRCLPTMRWEQWAKNPVKSKKSLKHLKALRMRHHQHLLKRWQLLPKNPRPMAMTSCLHKRMPRAQKMKLKWKTGRKLVSLPKNLPPKTQQQSHKAPPPRYVDEPDEEAVYPLYYPEEEEWGYDYGPDEDIPEWDDRAQWDFDDYDYPDPEDFEEPVGVAVKESDPSDPSHPSGTEAVAASAATAGAAVAAGKQTSLLRRWGRPGRRPGRWGRRPGRWGRRPGRWGRRPGRWGRPGRPWGRPYRPGRVEDGTVKVAAPSFDFFF